MVRSRKIMLAVSLLSACPLVAQQPSPPAKSPKLCVASVGNGSLKPIQVNEVKDTLVNGLVAAKLNIDSAASATLVARKLELSGNNQESIRLRKCDFMLLTSVDSAKPTPASGSDLLLSFALFKRNVAKALIDTALPAPGADTPTQSILKVVDQEVQQVSQSIAKK